MAGDVENILDAKRALLLGISHELRTPLSRMRLELEFLDDDELLEVTPLNLRLRKKLLKETDRKRESRQKAS